MFGVCHASELQYYSQPWGEKVLPVGLHVVLYMDCDPVAPIRFDRGSRVLTIYGQHHSLNTVRSHRDIFDREPVLKSVFRKERTEYLPRDACVRRDVVVVGIDVVLTPALPVRGTVDTGSRTRACRRVRTGRRRART